MPRQPKPEAAPASKLCSRLAARERLAHFARPRPAREIDIRAHLLDSGYVDSLSATELLADIERRYGVRIDEMDIVGRLCTIEALASEIESRASGSAK